MPSRSSSSPASDDSVSPYIYVACPWTPKGGGMFKVADYLIQSQSSSTPQGAAYLRPLDTRGGASALLSIWVLLTALCKLTRGRASGRLAGVHVNMAERLSLFRKGVVIAFCSALRIPIILHLHAAQLHHFYRALPRPLQALTRWVFSLPATCIVLGSAARDFVTRELRVAPEKVVIVINGVPEPSAPRRICQPGQLRRVLFLGNLSERKGVSDLLRALALPVLERDNLLVSFAGGGDVAGYETLANELGIGNLVRFEGWSDQQKAAGLIAAADVLILPSYDEGLPLVILEALANGVAVICTPVGEIPSVLSDGLNACFVSPGDVPAIASALQNVLSDPAFRSRLETNGRTIYKEQFSMALFFAHIADVHKAHFGLCASAPPAAGVISEKTL